MDPGNQRVISYLPGPLRRSRLRDSTTPWCEPLSGAILFADVAGFTRLVEEAALQGPEGAERLSELLCSVFGRIADLAYAFRGDVIEYAGDATIIIFEAGNDGMGKALESAAACAIELPHILESAAANGGTNLTMRIGIASGSLVSVGLGDTGTRQFYLLAGKPIDVAGRACSIAASGEIAIDVHSASLLGQSVEARSLGPEFSRICTIVTGQPRVQRDPSQAPPADIQRLGHYLPIDIIRRVTSAGAQWLAEFRYASILFVAFDGIDYTGTGFLCPLQDAVRTAQDAVGRFGGEILQFLADDKGTVLLATWGLPGCTHEDDGARSVNAAEAISTSLTHSNVTVRMGIARGRVFCGERGGDKRRDYAMLGDTVNRAARLMQHASTKMLCDEETRRACKWSHSFDEGTSIEAKGLSESILVYQSTGKRQKAVAESSGVVGRDKEKALLRALFNDPQRRHAILFEGEPGIGKSALLGLAINQARSSGFRCFTGLADVNERSTPYFAWRSVLIEVLDSASGEKARIEDALSELLRDAPALDKYSALLGMVLGLNIGHPDETRQLTMARRSELVRDQFVHILQNLASDQPVLLIIDDAQWMDSASWSLARTVSNRVGHLHLIMGSRPIESPGSNDEAELRASPSLTRLALKPLDDNEILQLTARQLQVAELPPSLISFVREKSGGNPFFAQELVSALHEDDHIVISDGQIRVEAKLEMLDVPATVQDIVAGRIDRLDPDTQFTMKVASVIGRVFEFDTLLGVHPLLERHDQIPAQLATLEKRGLTQLESPDPELSYLFRHVITQEVTYGLLSFAQRRTLHAAAALWYENKHASELSAFYPLLGRHWSRAGDAQRAMHYYLCAGEQAVFAYANREAIRFFEKAIALAEDEQVTTSPAEQSRWHWLSGRAYLQLADNANSRRQLLRSLQLIGQPAPASVFTRVPKLIEQILRVMLGRPLTLRRGVASSKERPMLIQAAGVHHDLGEIAYFDNDLLGLAYSAVCAVNLANATADAAVVARSYTTACVAVANGGLYTLARKYRQRAIEAADCTEDIASRAYSHMGCALFHSGLGEWSDIDKLTAEAAKLFEQIGDRYRWEMTTNLRAYALLHQGHFAEARPLLEAALASASADDTLQAPIIAVSGLIMIDLEGHKVDQKLLAKLQRLAKLADDMAQPSDSILANGALALAALEQGDMNEARRMAARVAGKFKRVPLPSFYTYRSLSAMIEVAIADCQLARSSAPNRTIRACDRLAAKRLKKLEWFAKYFPIAKPRTKRLAAELALSQGRTKLAHTYLVDSVNAANNLAMHYERTLTEGISITS